MPTLKKILGDWRFMKKIDAVPSDAPFVPKPIDYVSEVTEWLRSGKLISKDDFPAHLKGGQVFLDEQSLPFVFYISDQNHFVYNWTRRIFDRHGYKFHFRWCSTLQAQDNRGRIKRYRAKYDICNPEFKINDGNNNARIKVCLNCCNGFSRNGKTVYEFFSAHGKDIEKEFDMPSFFEEFGIINLPRSTHPGGPDAYTANWRKVSQRERKKFNWQCQDPNHEGDRNFRNNQQNLHVHHIDGVKSHNVSDNLEVLCHICHAKRHSHM